MGAHRGQTAVAIIVESHELGPEEYRLSVVGQPQSLIFRLNPSEQRIMQIDISMITPGPMEIQLWKSGQVYRSLRLTGPDPSRL